MKTIDLIQGSPEWLAHRAQHFNASDAPAMMGCSPYMTRTELLVMKKTGITADVDPATQRRFDDGHRFEALARPLAEQIVGEELYAVTGTNGELSASFDGLTLMEDTAFEHKTLNADLRECMEGLDEAPRLPLHYRVQMEQQLMVSGAQRVLFMATRWEGDTLAEERHCWYTSDAALRSKIIAGWQQFAADLVNFTPVELLDKPAPVGHSPDQLPALRSSVRGELVLESNIKEWETAALAYIKTVRDHELVTDEDFANGEAAAKWCATSRTTLEGVKSALMSATGDVNTAVGTIDRIMAELDKTRISFTNAGKARKDARKAEIVAAGVAGLRDHIAALNTRLGKPYMPAVPADFGGAIKGKSSLAKMQDAVDTELANAKIRANEVADKIDANLKHLRETASAHTFLFADAGTIVLKAPDDLQALVANRINEHQRQEAAKEEAQRDRIRAEEAAKLQREADEKRRAEEAEAQRAAQAAIAAAATPSPAPAPAPAPMVRLTAIPEADVQITTSAPARVSPAIPHDSGARLSLGQINERIAPVSINVAGLAALGYEPVEQVKASRLYRESDFSAICAAIVRHVQGVAQGVAA